MCFVLLYLESIMAISILLTLPVLIFMFVSTVSFYFFLQVFFFYFGCIITFPPFIFLLFSLHGTLTEIGVMQYYVIYMILYLVFIAVIYCIGNTRTV